MSKRKAPSAIGLSMLDLISNSLASVIILFIIISSVRIPSIPPERIKGTLFIKLELQPHDKTASSESIVWVEPPNVVKGEEKSRFFGSEIFSLNKNKKIFGKFSDCGESAKPSNGARRFITPCIAVYAQKDSTNVHYIVIRDPIKEMRDKKIDWVVGLLYVDHEGYKTKPQPMVGKMQAWFIGDENQDSLHVETFLLDAPTHSKGFKLNLDRPNLNN